MLNARYQSQSEIIDKAKVFKWHLHFPNVILVVRSSETHTEKRLSTYTKVLDSEKLNKPSVICLIFLWPIESHLF